MMLMLMIMMMGAEDGSVQYYIPNNKDTKNTKHAIECNRGRDINRIE